MTDRGKFQHKKDQKTSNKSFHSYTQPIENYRNKVGKFKEKVDHKAEKGQTTHSREANRRDNLRINTGNPSNSSYGLLVIIGGIFFLFLIMVVSFLINRKQEIL
jgi:hypothetical protein